MNDEVTSTASAFPHRRLDGIENLDDVGGMRPARAVRALLGDRSRELAECPAPVDAVEGVRHRDGLVGAAEGRELDRGIEVLPARHEQRAVVAVELDPLLLALLADVEARRQPHERSVRELDQRDAEVGGADRERLARDREAIGVDDLAVCRHAAGRAEHGRQDRERVDADVGHRPDRVERRGPWVPRLDAAPVDLGVDDADRSRSRRSAIRFHAVSCASPMNVIGEHESRSPLACGELDEAARLGVAPCHRLLAVDVLSGFEGGRRDLGVDSMGGEVDDGIDRWIRDQRLEVG